MNMEVTITKIKKRDGREVDFAIEKIINAIGKAFKSQGLKLPEESLSTDIFESVN